MAEFKFNIGDLIRIESPNPYFNLNGKMGKIIDSSIHKDEYTNNITHMYTIKFGNNIKRKLLEKSLTKVV